MSVAAVPFPGWHPHLDVWLLVAAVSVAYAVALRRERGRRQAAGDRRPVASGFQVGCFAGGVLVMWLASDWPIHDVAEGYLYSVHMVQHLLFTLVVALLVLAGTPGWLAGRIVGTGRRLGALKAVTRPVPNLIQFNLILVLSHWPLVVEATVRHHPLHFVAHAVLLGSAVLMWMPVASPLREVPRANPPLQMLYLFLQTILPTVPASFLTFGKTPLYRIYATFPRLWGVSALSDQQTAGLIMKILGGMYFWFAIAVIFFRWYGQEQRHGPAAETLHWDEVEEELQLHA